jgi:hypothetical protein
MDIPRGIPTPPPDVANERVHRLDAEAEAFMKQHAKGILYALEQHGDPTAYAGWHEAACRQHWPELWARWRAVHQAKDRLAALLTNARQRYS